MNRLTIAKTMTTPDDGGWAMRVTGAMRRLARALVEPTHGVAPEEAGRLRAEMISAVISITPNIMAASIIGSLMCALVFWGSPVSFLVNIWAAFVTILATRGFLSARRSRQRAQPEEVSIRALYRLVINAASAGVLWSLIFVMAYPGADQHQQLLLSCIMVGAITAGLFGMLTVPSAAASYAAGISIPCCLVILLSGNPQAWNTTAMYAGFIFISMSSVLWYQRLFVERFASALEVQRQSELIGILLRDFEANVSDWLWETDAQGRLQLISQALSKLTGLEADDIRGRDFLAFVSEMQDEAPIVLSSDNPVSLLKLALTMRAPFNGIEIPVLIKGNTHWWSLTGKPIMDRHGQLKGYRGVGSDITQRRQSQDKITFMAHYDPLTELPNRAFFHHHLVLQIARVEKGHSAGFGLMFIDLDEFKAVNDGLGHGAGDRLLTVIGNRLRATLSPQVVLARLGGDEFAVIAPDETDCVILNRMAEEMIHAACEPVLIDHHVVTVGASIGIAVAPHHGRETADLLRRADLALYRAKALGRSKACFFEPAVEDTFQKRRVMEDALRFAIDRMELDIYYQPIIDLGTGKIVGAEALLRWRHATQGWIAPDEFIPIAEASGLIVPLGEWVIRRACFDAMEWPKDMRVSVNLSPVQFKSARLPAAVVSALAASHLPGARLELEITESVLMNESEAATVIEQLRVLGTHLALDDFGVGYSSLSYLRKFPFDKIKIDKSFVRDARNNPLNYGIIETIAELGNKLHMAITVEGIENESDAESVRAVGCHFAQGYHFGRPMPKEDLLKLIGKTGAQSQSAQMRIAR